MPKVIEPILTPQDALWGRQVNDRQLALEDAQARSILDQAATNKAVAASLDALVRQVNALPVPLAGASTVSPVSASSTDWTTLATVTLTAPANRSSATFNLIGTVALLDTITGGIAAPPSARFLLNGFTPYPRANGVPAAKDSGASNVNNVVTVGTAGTIPVTPGDLLSFALQVQVFHATAYATASPSNFGALGVQATFS